MFIKILSFLFVPESELSVAFLLIFGVVWIYGVVKRICCKKTILGFEKHSYDEYSSSAKNDTPEAFVDNFDRELSAEDSKIIDLPNVFVSIGIVGTFIGLGIALKDASGLLNAEKVDIDQLKVVLDVIAFKFQISVWGTASSLFFQIFVVEPYNVFRDRCLSKIVRDLHLNVFSMAEKQLSTAEEQLAGVNELKNDMHNFIIASESFSTNVADFKKFVEGYTSVQDEIATNLKNSISDMTGKTSDIAKILTDKNMEMCDKVTNVMDSLAGDLDGNFRTYKEGFLRAQTDFVKKQGESFKEFVSNELLDSHREYLHQMSGIEQSIGDLTNSTVQLTEAVSDIKNHIEAVRDVAKDQVEEIGKEIKEEQKKFGDTAIKLSDICHEMHKANVNTEAKLREITKDVLPNLFQEINPKIVVDELKEIKTDVGNSSQKIIEGIKGLEKSSGEQRSENVKDVLERVAGVSSDIKSVAAEVAKISQHTTKTEYDKMLQGIGQLLISVNSKLDVVANSCKTQQNGLKNE